jgi:hypothetical protein
MNTIRYLIHIRSEVFDRNSRNFPLAYLFAVWPGILGAQEVVAYVGLAKVLIPVRIDNGHQLIRGVCKKHIGLLVHMRNRQRKAATARALVLPGILIYRKGAVHALGTVKTSHERNLPLKDSRYWR